MPASDDIARQRPKLVFFIYTMLSMAVHHGQSVDLPQSSNATLETQEAMSITIQATSLGITLFVDEKPVRLELLNERLPRKKVERQDYRDIVMQIFTDKSISFQELFQVLERVRLAGMARTATWNNTTATVPSSKGKGCPTTITLNHGAAHLGLIP